MPEQPVLALEDDLDPRRDEVGHERRHPDAQVDVVAVAQLLGRATRDPIARRQLRRRAHAAPPAAAPLVVLRSIRFS